MIFDPGYDNVVGEIKGKGVVSCRLSTFFFKKLNEHRIPNHYIETIGNNVILAKQAQLLNMESLYNLEFVYRDNAYGSFLRRYPFVPFCMGLNGLIEITTKGKTDHLITEDVLAKLGILTREEVDEAKDLVKKTFKIIREEVEKKGLHLIDGKIELGKINGKIQVIDDISPDVLRVCRGAKLDEKGNCMTKCGGKNVLNPLELYEIMMGRRIKGCKKSV